MIEKSILDSLDLYEKGDEFKINKPQPTIKNQTPPRQLESLDLFDNKDRQPTVNQEVIIEKQSDLDNLPRDFKGIIHIDFGTQENPAQINKEFFNAKIHLERSSYALNRCENTIELHNKSIVDSCCKSIIIAKDDSIVIANGDTIVDAYDKTSVQSFDDAKITLHDQSFCEAYGNSKVTVKDESHVESFNNSTIIYDEKNVREIHIETTKTSDKDFWENISDYLSGKAEEKEVSCEEVER